jgi:hypothetical protein
MLFSTAITIVIIDVISGWGCMHHQPLPAFAAPVNGWSLYIWWMGDVGPSSAPLLPWTHPPRPHHRLIPPPWKTPSSLMANCYVFCHHLLQQPPPMLENAAANNNESNAR